MAILVTGAAGFLGYHLCESFLRDGKTVIGLDNFSSGQHCNIARLMKDHPDTFTFLTMDVQDISRLKSGDVATWNLDLICNLACVASPPLYQADPIQTFNTSVLGVINLVKLAQMTRAKLFHTSTSEIYGDPLVKVQSESYWGNVNPTGPRACYDEGKRAAETYLSMARDTLGVDVRIARIFNTYGPQMSANDGRVVTNFINQALDNQPMTVYGYGEQTRSFCYVDDLIRGFRLLIDSGYKYPMNLGNPTEFTISELVDKVAALYAAQSGESYIANISLKELPVDDPMQRCPDITRAKTLLGWEPTIDLDTGLKLTFEYFAKLKAGDTE